jgi:hypothetical protein
MYILTFTFPTVKDYILSLYISNTKDLVNDFAYLYMVG